MPQVQAAPQVQPSPQVQLVPQEQLSPQVQCSQVQAVEQGVVVLLLVWSSVMVMTPPSI